MSQEAIDALLASALAPVQPAAKERRDMPSLARTQEPGHKPLPVTPINGLGGVGLENLVYGLDVELTVVLGETELRIRDVLNLGAGSIVELDGLVGLPVDVRLAGRTVARAEVVVVEDAYAIRIVENLVRQAR